MAVFEKTVAMDVHTNIHVCGAKTRAKIFSTFTLWWLLCPVLTIQGIYPFHRTKANVLSESLGLTHCLEACHVDVFCD